MQKSRRILLKISGEALGGDDGFGVNPQILKQTVEQIVEIHKANVQVALVVGGGNLFRGSELQKAGLDRVVGDQMGMLATIMNALALKDQFSRFGVDAIVMSAYGVNSITTQYQALLARSMLEQNSVLILAGGTGSPFFTTDTTAVLRAIELNCDEVLKATKVDGIYSCDPNKDPNAKRFDKLSYADVLKNEYEVMDLTAFALARDHKMPIRVFNMNKPQALFKAATSQDEGTIVID